MIIQLGVSHEDKLGTTIVALVPNADKSVTLVYEGFHPPGDSSVGIRIEFLPQHTKSNIEIDEWLRKAFEFGENYRTEHDTGKLSDAHDIWREFEKYIAEVMIKVNGHTNVI